MISRSLNLRRLSFVLLAAERNHYLAQLPSIQEKLVDILRTDIVSPRVHSEVSILLASFKDATGKDVKLTSRSTCVYEF